MEQEPIPEEKELLVEQETALIITEGDDGNVANVKRKDLGNSGKVLKGYIKMINVANAGIQGTMKVVFGIVETPVMLVFGIIFTFLTWFLYMLW